MLDIDPHRLIPVATDIKVKKTNILTLSNIIVTLCGHIITNSICNKKMELYTSQVGSIQ